MDKLFIVVWGGNTDAPAYVAKRTVEEATAQAIIWTNESDIDEGDWVDVLSLDLNTLELTRHYAEDLVL